MITELCRQQTEQCTVKRAHCKCAWKQLWQDYSAVSIFSPWRVCNRNICVWYCHTVSWVKVRITDRHRQPSVCKSPAQRKSLWNTGIWKNEHNRLWLSGCVTMWLHDRVAVRLSVSRRGAVWKLKPFTTAASSHYILVCCNRLVVGYCILWKMLNDDT